MAIRESRIRRLEALTGVTRERPLPIIIVADGKEYRLDLSKPGAGLQERDPGGSWRPSGELNL